MAKQTYIKNDLQDYADTSVNWNNYQRKRALIDVLPDEAVVEKSSTGGYEGELVLMVVLDGYIWLRHTFYGSCSGCDGFMGGTKSELMELLRGFYCFEHPDDAIEYLESTDDFGYSATGLKSKAIDMVED